MNCKQGDLAIVVKSVAGNEGKIVTCVRRATIQEAINEGLADIDALRWVVDKDLPTARGGVFEGTTRLARDSWLRPLRDNDGEDEMLRIAGKPEVITQ